MITTDVLAVGDGFARTAESGALLAALGVAALAGLVSFASPCVLPLVPAYVSYVTGMSGAELETAQRRGRVVLGVLLFVLGFTVVFVSLGTFFGGIGFRLVEHQEMITRIAGVLVIIMGLAFMGLIPGLDRTWRLQTMPKVGLAGAPVLGAVFGIGWLPCIGPTLAAVLTLSATSASAGRGALLTAAYALGLGIPFLLVALAYSKALEAFGWARRNARTITRIGGGMLVVLGVLMVTGGWDWLIVRLQSLVTGVETAI